MASEREWTERGFTLPELLVSLTLTLFLALSLFKLVDMNQRLTRDEQDITAMQQNGRAAMEFMVRDLHSAGYDLVNRANMSESGVVFPNADCSNTHTQNAITVWCYRNGPQATIVDAMPQDSSEFKVDAAAGFTDGDYCVIMGMGDDGQWHFDLLTVTHSQTSADHLQHNLDKLSTSYQPGAKILMLDIVTYYLANNAAGATELYRQFRKEPAAAVAVNVKSLVFRYYDKSNPPVELTAVTSPAERIKIRKVTIDLEVETERPALDTHQRRVLALRSEVAPRNLVYLRNTV